MPSQTAKVRALNKGRSETGLRKLTREKAELAAMSEENLVLWKQAVLNAFDAGNTRKQIADMVTEELPEGESCSVPWIALVLREMRGTA